MSSRGKAPPGAASPGADDLGTAQHTAQSAAQPNAPIDQLDEWGSVVLWMPTKMMAEVRERAGAEGIAIGELMVYSVYLRWCIEMGMEGWSDAEMGAWCRQHRDEWVESGQIRDWIASWRSPSRARQLGVPHGGSGPLGTASPSRAESHADATA